MAPAVVLLPPLPPPLAVRRLLPLLRRRRRKKVMIIITWSVTIGKGLVALTVSTEKEESDEDMGFGLFD